MTATPWAVTAAVARSAAGRWRLVADASAPPYELNSAAAQVAAGWRWPTHSPLTVPESAPDFLCARLHEPLKNRITADRACDLALDLADDLTATAPWLSRLPAELVGISCTVSKGAIGPLVDAVNPQRTISEETWTALCKVSGPDAAANWVAERLHVRGPRLAPVAACATGVANLACAARLLERDGLAAVICGGAESSLHPAVAASMRAMGILDALPMRPFDARRGGFNLGEGGGLLLLEPARRAGGHAAPALAWLTGARLYADAHHMTDLHPRQQTLTRLMRDLLQHRPRTSAAGPGDTGAPGVGRTIEKLYINAHATATRLNDPWETLQLIDAFGPAGWARREGRIDPQALVVISGTKSLTGHLLGASATVEAMICVAVLCGAPPPPTLQLIEPHEPWPAVLRDFNRLQLLGDPTTGRGTVTGADAVRPFDAALSLNYGFGGHVGGALFERVGSAEKVAP